MSNSWINMTENNGKSNNGNGVSFETSISLAAAGNSAAVLIPNGVKDIMVTVVPGGGATGKVQTSTDLVYTVKEGSVTWVDWSAGAVAATTTGVCYPVTAIRLVQAGAGTAKLLVKAQ